MKTTHRWALGAAAVLSLGYLISLAMAQGPAPAPARGAGGSSIAILDVGYIIKNHSRLKGMLQDLNRDGEQAQKRFQAARDDIGKLEEGLAQFHKGTDEYSRREEDVANRKAKFAVDLNRQKKEFLQAEAKIYNTVYQEMWQATNYYCKQNAIELVLQFNGDPADVDRPDSVLRAINKPVVWNEDRLDITPIVLEQLNRAPVNAADQRGGVPPRQSVPFNP